MHLHYTDSYRYFLRMKFSKIRVFNSRMEYFRRFQLKPFFKKIFLGSKFFHKFPKKSLKKIRRRSKTFLDKFLLRFTDEFAATLPKNDKLKYIELKAILK